jgi:hypothetical protein
VIMGSELSREVFMVKFDLLLLFSQGQLVSNNNQVG